MKYLRGFALLILGILGLVIAFGLVALNLSIALSMGATP